MRITESQLRTIVKRMIAEGDKSSEEPKKYKGSLDVKKLSTTLGVDYGDLQRAIAAARSGQERTPAYNKVLADVFVKLMGADPDATTKVMNMLKQVSAEQGEKK